MVQQRIPWRFLRAGYAGSTRGRAFSATAWNSVPPSLRHFSGRNDSRASLSPRSAVDPPPKTSGTFWTERISVRRRARPPMRRLDPSALEPSRSANSVAPGSHLIIFPAHDWLLGSFSQANPRRGWTPPGKGSPPKRQHPEGQPWTTRPLEHPGIPGRSLPSAPRFGSRGREAGSAVEKTRSQWRLPPARQPASPAWAVSAQSHGAPTGAIAARAMVPDPRPRRLDPVPQLQNGRAIASA